MREIKTGLKRRKKRRQRSAGCFAKGMFLLILFSVLGLLGIKVFQDLGITTYLLQLQYPIRYQAEVESVAGEFDLDPALVYGVIHTESKFDPYAVSTANAKGLMQLQDETARDCAKALKIDEFSTEQIFEPQMNIRLGCYYLKKLIQTYHGEIETALAAYNSGPGNVSKWLKDPSLRNQDGVLQIPFPETRNYIKKVLRSRRTYQELYNLK